MTTPSVPWVVCRILPPAGQMPAAAGVLAAHTTPGTPIIDLPAAPLPQLLARLPAAYAGYDVLLVPAGSWVPLFWDARLAWAAQAERVAAVVPLDAGSPLLALSADPAADPAVLDRLAYALSGRGVFELPVLPLRCVYLRRAALAALPDLPDDGDRLARAWRAQGWDVVGCEHVYVQTPSPKTANAEPLPASVQVWLTSAAPPLAVLRQAVQAALTEPTPVPDLPLRPVQLHIVNSWGGGLDRWVASYCAGDDRRVNLVLRSIGTWGAFGQRLALYASHRSDTPPLRVWELHSPIRATAATHRQYRQILADIIDTYGVDALLVSSLIGHALDALATRLPTLLITHDYYPFCPALYIYFAGVCHDCGTARLDACYADNPHNRFFRNVAAGEWRELRTRYADLLHHRSLVRVAPSASVARHLNELLPAAADVPFTLIPHGVDLPLSPLPLPPVRATLRVVVLGALAEQKGRALLAALLPEMAATVAFYLVGAGEDGQEFQSQQGVTLLPRYRPEELPTLLAGIEPDLGLLLSICPETFSFTLSELWQCGVPVLATAVGSFADRIEEGVNGFLCAPDPVALRARLQALAADRAALAAVRVHLAEAKPRTVAAMIADYHALLPLPPLTARRYFARTTPVAATAPARALLIDPQARFRAVLREFWQYVLDKLTGTPRLKPWQRRLVLRLLRR